MTSTDPMPMQFVPTNSNRNSADAGLLIEHHFQNSDDTMLKTPDSKLKKN